MTVTTHNLGFPRIGAKRELKFALENYWKNPSNEDQLLETAKQLRLKHWRSQQQMSYIPVGDFSLYDHVLDLSIALGNIPKRFASFKNNKLQQYFNIARGYTPAKEKAIFAGEMTKWFDTNYHYIVPEFDASTTFTLSAQHLLAEIIEAKQAGIKAKPVLIGPVTYLYLGKSKDDTNKLDLLEPLLHVYGQLLNAIRVTGIDWVQIDEPILSTELSTEWRQALNQAYHTLKSSQVNILLTSYFGQAKENLKLACELPVAGNHIDLINGADELQQWLDWLPAHKVLSLGVINGRNIWKSDLNALIDQLEPIHQQLKDKLWLAPSCSLLHVPVDLDQETALDPEIKNWLAFATQKLEELHIIAQALNLGRESVQAQLQDNALAIQSRRNSQRVHKEAIKASVKNIHAYQGTRINDYQQRAQTQKQWLNLPPFPTTTIGSFPQTAEIRQTRSAYRKGDIDDAQYRSFMQQEIQQCIAEQEKLELDVLVHGEAERNDMVEYFGQQLEGYAFSELGWVQSYGSRCVKPPIIYGDIERTAPITVDWALYAQSCTNKHVKGMLTGPVTMLNWSFVRDDQARSETCLQLALAIREEVLDLEKNGIRIIQIDEAALREGLPLRQQDWQHYLNWSVEAFRIAANGVSDQTQIHTHMCYSEFNDIIEAIASMDADVITIETSRSDMELLEAFEDFDYPNDIGPGVYDIHTPNIPSTEQIVNLVKKAAEKIPLERLWINPDCGLKTRHWDQVKPALENMVTAAKTLRQALAAG